MTTMHERFRKTLRSAVRRALVWAILFACPLVAHAAEPEASQPRLVVEPFSDRTAALSPDELKSAREYLKSRLTESRRYVVIPHERYDAALERRKEELKRKSHDEGCDDNCRIELGRELSANFMVVSSVGKLGEVCSLNVTLIDLEKNTERDAVPSEFACGPDQLRIAIKRVVCKLTSDKEGGCTDSQDVWAGASVPPPEYTGSTFQLVEFLVEPKVANAVVELSEKTLASESLKTMLRPGNYTARVTAPHYKAALVPFEVTEARDSQREPQRVRIRLEPNFGSVAVNSQPSGARVFLDGADTGRDTPTTFEVVDAGAHRVELRLAQHSNHEERFELQQREVRRINAKLVPRHGSLIVIALDDNGRELADIPVRVASNPAQSGTTPVQFRLLEGDYDIEVGDGRNSARARETVVYATDREVRLKVRSGERQLRAAPIVLLSLGSASLLAGGISLAVNRNLDATPATAPQTRYDDDDDGRYTITAATAIGGLSVGGVLMLAGIIDLVVNGQYEKGGALPSLPAANGSRVTLAPVVGATSVGGLVRW